ncbi:MAG TPA: hypothetical protein VNG69_15320 [Casimicrobiaceae bacterium]|nr:hypothetical protein [Casimicrobiaceae bacterium]
MADYPPPHGSALPRQDTAPTTAALIAYILFGLAALTQIGGSGLVVPAPLLTLIGIIGVIVAYVKRSEARGTWLESHMSWLISTFWWSTVWAVIGWIVFLLLAIVLIGFALGPLIWAITAIWVLYRVIRGFVYFKDQRPIPL